MSSSKFTFLLAFFLVVLLSACKQDPPSDTGGETLTSQVDVPRFDRDSAYAYVRRQVQFGPRVLGTEAHEAAKEWLVSKFREFGATVTEQNFTANVYTGESFPATNIVAQYNPANNNRIMLAAHWDTRHIADSPLSTERKDEPVLGADDGGSGVAVLLEIARQLQAKPIDLGVDLVLFDAEDYGETGADSPDSWGLGAQYWSRNIPTPHRPRYGILLDMVGARGARFPVEAFSMRYAPQIVAKVWKLAQQQGYGNYFVEADGGGVTDDHYFVNTIARIPMIDIVNRPVDSQTGFGHYWHTHQDNLDIIDPRTLRAVGQVVLGVVYREAAGVL